MKCDKCGSVNVVTKIVIQNDKGTEEINLCLDCFQKFLKDHPDIQNGPAGRSINDFLLGAMNYLSKGIRTLNQNRNINITDTRICPNCSTPVQMIKKEGRAGCAKCYEFFGREISDRLFYSTGKRYEFSKDDQAEGKRSKEVIRERIAAAVKSENYELAADLTRKLKRSK
ncbi:MAG: hypothetical protein PHF33_04315 [Candidatus Delongbacteria bacterium]|nr:hypothetical protein [Candidatus Delongbacteria bacterium]